ncbi:MULTISPECIES: hypothetical protein [Prolixibacter]|uniref:Uncharacterized protein n=1 Tax=Prolixibacter denitrificans TaxID=1541063 RepID=A0A2P8CCK3_9BACT|nr:MULTISPECIES: hypothetical protein [Prolixibacter]PSK82703.1 hypothetical protein CLV93_10595 [Prolixibacter denitrificans]GET21475.1 hypothetical protein JCM18694_17210 [Prolixibacter denitrificans]GET24087.1 hypothetical protein NT017_04160 [Prolixibacter sp. NT017]
MRITGIILLTFLSFQLAVAQNLKPYILGVESAESVADLKGRVATNLEQNGIQVVGQYEPAADANRWLLVVTSPELQKAVETVGGLTGFASTLRVAITKEDGKTLVTYTNPEYWGNAYFRDDYNKVASDYAALTAHLESAMKATGTFVGKPFGSEKGLSIKDLHKYHYMIGMPRFDDTVELGEFDNYQTALNKVNSSVDKGVPNVKEVYKVAIPGKDLTLYGFALSGEDGESDFLPTIDISQPKHTAFLPYEVLVDGNQVLMLHGRYRIALSFPDLTMGIFTKIMSTPGNIKDMLEQLTE